MKYTRFFIPLLLSLILTPADRDYLVNAVAARTPDLTFSERTSVCYTILKTLADNSTPSTAAAVLDSVLDKSDAPPPPSEEDLRLTEAALNQAMAKFSLEEENHPQ